MRRRCRGQAWRMHCVNSISTRSHCAAISMSPASITFEAAGRGLRRRDAEVESWQRTASLDVGAGEPPAESYLETARMPSGGWQWYGQARGGALGCNGDLPTADFCADYARLTPVGGTALASTAFAFRSGVFALGLRGRRLLQAGSTLAIGGRAFNSLTLLVQQRAWCASRICSTQCD